MGKSRIEEDRRRGDDESPPTHLIIARAADDKPDGNNIQVKISVSEYPSDTDVKQVRRQTIETFRSAFEENPTRVGIGILPWLKEEDDIDV